MNNTIWQELGIEPTTDELVIRRAYATRLRQIHVDHDSDAFMRLRNAYEHALRICDEYDVSDGDADTFLNDALVLNDAREIGSSQLISNQRDSDTTAPNDASCTTEMPSGLPMAGLAAFEDKFHTELNASEVRSALATLRAALANGLIPIGSACRFVNEFLAHALTDASLSLEEFEEIERIAKASGLTHEQERSLDIQMLLRRAENGSSDDQYDVGVLLLHGFGQEMPDAHGASAWFHKAALRGHAGAQTYLGFLYEYGRGVSRDHAEAVRWYRLAAEQGEITAQSNLGEMYLYGRGLEKDPGQAWIWLHKAAKSDDASAQFKLGMMYLYGEGIELDHVRAYGWLKLAFANQAGDLDWASARMTSEEISAAERWLQERGA